MNLSRRMLLQVAVAGGAAAAVATPLSSARAALAAEPVRLLIGGQTPASFVPGVRAALASAGLLADLQGGAMDAVAWLQARPGRRMIGLVDSADAVLVRELARDGRLRWLASGHHSQRSLDHLHAVDSLPGSRGLADVLAEANGDWAPVLGRALGQIAAGRWQGAEAPGHPAGSGQGGVMTFASFVIAS